MMSRVYESTHACDGPCRTCVGTGWQVVLPEVAADRPGVWWLDGESCDACEGEGRCLHEFRVSVYYDADDPSTGYRGGWDFNERPECPKCGYVADDEMAESVGEGAAEWDEPDPDEAYERWRERQWEDR